MLISPYLCWSTTSICMDNVQQDADSIPCKLRKTEDFVSAATNMTALSSYSHSFVKSGLFRPEKRSRKSFIPRFSSWTTSSVYSGWPPTSGKWIDSYVLLNSSSSSYCFLPLSVNVDKHEYKLSRCVHQRNMNQSMCATVVIVIFYSSAQCRIATRY